MGQKYMVGMIESALKIGGKIKKNKILVFSLFTLFVLGLMAICPRFFSSRDPYAMVSDRFLNPSRENFFGTDEMGRDIYTRVIYGARISLLAGVTTTIIALSIGTILGMFAGFCGGKIDEIIMRFSDIFVGFPPLIMAMVIVATVGQSITNAMVALGIVWWPEYARLVRIGVASTKTEVFVEAARSFGASNTRILLKHILPQNISVIVIKATIDVGWAILMIAALSFLGLGARPPLPEWGILITRGRTFMLDAWWYPTFPGIAVGLTVLCLNVIGDWLRDLLDPTLEI